MWDMRAYTIGWTARLGEGQERVTQFTVWRYPLWAWIIDRSVNGWLCTLTRHRFCNSAPMATLDKLASSHAEMFAVEVPDAEITRFETWRGGTPPYWADDE